MLPFILLFVFLGLAFIAIGSFAFLTMKDTDAGSRREDWKKFLSSFAGTALALSIGFVSFMLQQNSQNTLRHEQETDQIKARLVYSLIQNSAIVRSRFTVLNIGEKVAAICGAKATESDKESAFKAFKIHMQKSVPAMKETLTRLDASGAFKQDTIIKLLEQTSVASRISPQLAQAMSQKELLLAAQAPGEYARILDSGQFETKEVFCAAAQEGWFRMQAILLDEQMLQAYTCAAYVAIDAASHGSIEMSSQLAKTIGELEQETEADVNVRRSKVAARLVPAVLFGQSIGINVAMKLNQCLEKIANMKLEEVYKANP